MDDIHEMVAMAGRDGIWCCSLPMFLQSTCLPLTVDRRRVLSPENAAPHGARAEQHSALGMSRRCGEPREGTAMLQTSLNHCNANQFCSVYSGL